MRPGASALLDPERATADEVLDTLARLRAAYPPGTVTEVRVRPPLSERQREWWGHSCLLLVVSRARWTETLTP